VIKKGTISGTDQMRVTFAVPSTAWADRVNLVDPLEPDWAHVWTEKDRGDVEDEEDW
jgi:hypothetical protein